MRLHDLSEQAAARTADTTAVDGHTQRSKDVRRIIIVGYGATGRELHRRAVAQQRMTYQMVATWDGESAAPLDARIETLTDLDELSTAVDRHRADEVWITLPLAEHDTLRRLCSQLGNTLADIRWIPDVLSLDRLSHRGADFLGLPVIELNRPACDGLAGVSKAWFDRVFAAVALVGLSPLLLVIAAAIKCTSAGPVFFSQPRLGLNGRPFRLLKFRSMRLHQEAEGQLTQATRNDPRITPLGRFLRKTSLDELPQFFNVLAGDMSVVGPRPHALVHNDLYKDKLAMYMQRHRVKPGITGWAQINGYRGETDTDDKMARRVELDLYYIRHWSFRMDLNIILWTTFRGWTDANAY
jgi:putative colanic acid biosynthesis UDP-glucose lipid carrier transferase